MPPLLNPAVIELIIKGIQAAVSAAPAVIEIATKAKEFITSLFKAGLISKELQDAIHARVDADCALALAGVVPSFLQVVPNPA